MDVSEVLPHVSVFTITYNQRSRIELTFKDICEQTYPHSSYEIIILDDGSTDGSPSLLDALAENSPVPTTIIKGKHTVDYWNARRWNQCIAAASLQTTVFIQIDDVRMRPDFIEKHVRWHCHGHDMLVTGPAFEGDEMTWDLRNCLRHSLAGPEESANTTYYLAAWGASLSFSKAAMQKVWNDPFDCPYDERMVGWGFHDIEFAYRMQMARATILYDPEVGVFHKNHTTETEQRRGLNRQLLVEVGSNQNEAYMCRKHNIKDLLWWGH